MACLNVKNRGEFVFNCGDGGEALNFWMELISLLSELLISTEVKVEATISPNWAEYYKSEVDMWQEGFTPKQLQP